MSAADTPHPAWIHIDRCADPSSHRYGRLVNWQNPGDPFWHYGVGLSDRHVFDTGRGLQVFERSQVRPVVGVASIHIPAEKAVERLKCALVAFADWEYNVLGWNCEHLARLICTNQPRCYQSKLIWMLTNLTPDGDHRLAREMFDDYLRWHRPDLLV